jgi:hypothetical protein
MSPKGTGADTSCNPDAEKPLVAGAVAFRPNFLKLRFEIEGVSTVFP